MLLQSGSAAGDCDGLQGAINRTYKKSHSPSGLLWFWALNLFPARRDEAAMVALKRNGCAPGLESAFNQSTSILH
jgi:hypothetical protein